MHNRSQMARTHHNPSSSPSQDNRNCQSRRKEKQNNQLIRWCASVHVTIRFKRLPGHTEPIAKRSSVSFIGVHEIRQHGVHESRVLTPSTTMFVVCFVVSVRSWNVDQPSPTIMIHVHAPYNVSQLRSLTSFNACTSPQSVRSFLLDHHGDVDPRTMLLVPEISDLDLLELLVGRCKIMRCVLTTVGCSSLLV